MMWFRKASPRRQAIREDRAESTSSSRPLNIHAGHTFLIVCLFLICAIAAQFWPALPLPYHIGDRAPTDLRSPVAFTIEDETQTEHLREATREMTPAVLLADRYAFDHLHNQLISLQRDLDGVKSMADVPASVASRFPGLTDVTLHRLQSFPAEAWASAVSTFVYRVLPNMPLITKADDDRLSERHSSRVALTVAPTITDSNMELNATDVIVLGSAETPARVRLENAAASELSEGVKELIAGYLLSLREPTYHYDAKMTETLSDLRAKNMKPFGRRIEENQVIVPSGTQILTEQYNALTEAQASLEKSVALAHPMAPWLAGLGRAMVVLILTTAATLYVVRMSKVARTVRRGWAVCGLLTLTLFVGRVAVAYVPQSLFLLGAAPVLLTAIILSIAYSRRFALGMSAIHGLLMTFTLGQSLDFYIPLLTGSTVFCLLLTELRTRGRLIEIGLASAAAMFVSVWAVGLSHMVGQLWSPWAMTLDLHVIAFQSLAAAGSGLLVAMFALALLPIVERTFRITTAMTLLELCDATKPLLLRLSQEAPGTFNHSLTVGIMAEAAGNAIGANGLLCRVGAYYHDVGKLSKPGYFVENQPSGGASKHDKLSPAMSLLIIVGHVKDGIELAREYGLPMIVHQFIAQHHGTTLVEYFFHAAKKKAEREGEDRQLVSESEFRYPGPKPQTREAAIVMICDACESVVRSIDEPTAGRIETAVHNMIMKRLMDGQFAECDLTLRDLSEIEETLIRALAGIHHGRVAYPAPVKPASLSQPA